MLEHRIQIPASIGLLLFLFFVFPLSFFITPAFALQKDLPSSFDLRDINGRSAIGPVKNQSPYGTCYSFGAAAAAESTYNRANDLYNDKTVSFSEPFIIWSLGQKYEGFPLGSFGDGANYEYDELQGLVDYGIIESYIFPYTRANMQAYNNDTSHELNYHWNAPRVKFSGWHRLPVNDVETMKRAIMKFGALDVAVNATDEFDMYTGGIFIDDQTVPDNPLETHATTNHAVSLVGWDDEDEAWILRNSWGSGWGEQGYMRIGYKSARVGVAAAYLHYAPWSGTDHEITNTENITASLDYSGPQPVSRGLYEWGGNNAFMINHGSIKAEADVEEGDPYVHGMFLWAGENSRIENSNHIEAVAYTDKGQATAYGIALQGNEILNTGSIEVQAASDIDDRSTAYGIRMFGFDDNAFLVNEGDIEVTANKADGWGYGMFTSDAGRIDNNENGEISVNAGEYALGILSYGHTEVNNQGEIFVYSPDSEAMGILMVGGNTTNSQTGTVTAETDSGYAVGLHGGGLPGEFIINNGTINAITDSGTATGIETATIENVYNSGLINVEALDPEAEIMGINSRYANLVENSGEIMVHGPGTAFGAYLESACLINTGTISASDTHKDSRALFLDDSTAYNNELIEGDTELIGYSILKGDGRFEGNVLNTQGLVSPGNSIGTMTITGDYHQGTDSVLEIEVNNNSSDLLRVEETAYLNGALSIIPQGYVTGNKYSFLDFQSISGEFATIFSPAVFNIGLENSPSGLDFDLSRNTYKSLVGDSSQKDMADVLDNIRLTAAGNMADTLNYLDTLDLSGFQDSMKDMYPGMHAAATYAGLKNTQRTTGYLQRRMQAGYKDDYSGFTHSKEEKTGKWNVWGTSAGSGAKVNARSSVPEFKEEMGGLMLGIDYQATENIIFGAAGAFTSQSLKQEGGSGSSTIKSYQGYLYSVWDELQDGEGLYVNSALGIGTMEFETDRYIGFMNQKARSDHSGLSWKASAGIGYNFITGNWSLRPGLETDYVYLKENSFSESGAGHLNLDINSHDSQSLQSRIGVNVSRAYRFRQALLMPELRLHWAREFFPDASDIKAAFNGGGRYFKAPGRDIPKNSGVLGVALNARFSDKISAGLDYEYTFMEGNQGHEQKINAQLRVRF